MGRRRLSILNFDMRRFLLNGFVFCLPLILLYAVAAGILCVAREFTSVQGAIDAQHNDPRTLVLYGYGNLTKAYKLALISEKKPDVIAIGTSRMMEFRSEFFTTSTHFVNAGGMDNASDLLAFIQRLPKDSPLRTVIVGVDPRYLERNDAPSGSMDSSSLLDRVSRFFSMDWRSVYADYAAHKFTLAELWRAHAASPNIGMTALVKQRGFRADGSHDYGPIVEDQSRLDALHALEEHDATEIRTTGRGSEYETEISTEHLAQITAFLDECRARGIAVVGILPPAPATIRDALMSLTDARGEVYRRLPTTLSAAFTDHGATFYDLSSLQTVGANEDEMLDVQHTTEKGTLRMLSYLAEHDPSIAPRVSTSTIATLLTSSSEVLVIPR